METYNNQTAFKKQQKKVPAPEAQGNQPQPAEVEAQVQPEVQPQVSATNQGLQNEGGGELPQKNNLPTDNQVVLDNLPQNRAFKLAQGNTDVSNEGASPQSQTNQAQVGQGTPADGGENVQWAGAPQGDVTSTYNNIINPPQAAPPLNAPVREFGGYNFSTVTPTGNTLSDADMDTYFNMLKKASENTGESIEDLDKRAGGLLVGKSQQAESSAENPQQGTTKKNAETTGNGSTGTPANTNGTNKGTVVDNANTAATGTGSANNGTTTPSSTSNPSTNTASTTTAPAVLTSEDYAKFSPSVLQTMAEIERNPMKKAMMQKAMQLQVQGAPQSQDTVTSAVKPPVATSATDKTTNPSTGATATKPRKPSKRQQARKDEAAQKMSNKDVYNGNVDLTNRKRVSGKEMRAAGYTDFPEDDYATLYSMQRAFKDKSKKGKYVEVLYTPIMADGTVLSQKEVDDYITGLGKKGNIVELDKPEHGGKGLVIRTGDSGDLGGGELHELQEAYSSTPEEFAAMGKDAEGRLNSMVGNQKPATLKPVTREDMVKAGWAAFSQYPDDEIYAHPIQQTIVDHEGKEHKVILSPITKDGDVLSPEKFSVYVKSLQGSKNILNDDAEDSGLILKYDAEDGDADKIYNDISAWLLGQPDQEEGSSEFNPLGQWYTDNVAQGLWNRMEQGRKEENDYYNRYLSGDASWRKTFEDTHKENLKKEGLDEEGEARLQKKRKVANIIANIGDLLQGFANIAGTIYGANSSTLTSLSTARAAGDEKVDARRQKRRDEIIKNRDKAIADMEKDYEKIYLQMVKANDRLENLFYNYQTAQGKTELRYQRSEEKAQRDEERKKRADDRKLKNDLTKIEANKQAAIEKQNNEFINKSALVAQRGSWKIKEKQTPSAKRDNSGGRGGKQNKPHDSLKK